MFSFAVVAVNRWSDQSFVGAATVQGRRERVGARANIHGDDDALLGPMMIREIAMM